MAPETAGQKLGDLAQAVGGTLVGDPNILISRPIPAGTSDPTAITWVGAVKYLRAVQDTQVAAILTIEEMREHLSGPLILVPNPRAAFAIILSLFERPMTLNEGIHPTAVVSPDAVLGEGVQVGAYSVIEAGAAIGAGAQIFAHGYVGENVQIGAGTVLRPRVTLYRDVRIGERCLIHSGVVIGSDGFGFEWNGQAMQKVPHVGGVVIGSDVEIGSNTAIDRAPMEDTVIADGVKLDNLVQVGHGAHLGQHSVIAAQCGISGSVQLGSRVRMGGQVGLGDHVKIGDDVMLAGKSAAFSDITEPGAYMGIPARPLALAHRILGSLPKLSEMAKRLARLERRIEKLNDDESQDA